MRIIYLFLLMLITTAIYAQPAGQGISQIQSGTQDLFQLIKSPKAVFRNYCWQQSPPKDTNHQRIRLRCGWPRPVVSPLLLVDGTMIAYAVLSTIDVNSIGDITVLKETESSAVFGPQGAAGAIVITTVKKNPGMIRVMDRLDRSAITGATITFISSDRRDTLMYVADSAGQVSRNELRKGVYYSVNVTATGYKAYAGPVTAIRNGEITLERDFILGPDVIVSSGHCCICRRHYVCQQQQVSKECGVQVKLVNEQLTEKTSSFSVNRTLSVYPNPVQRGQSVSLKLLQGYFPTGMIRVISLDGKPVATIPVNEDNKQGLVSLPIRHSWASGLYFLQLVYANGRVGASEKVIIQ